MMTVLSPPKPIPRDKIRDIQKAPSPVKKPPRLTPDFEVMATPIFRAAFIMTENRMTKEARMLVNGIHPQQIYDTAFRISEGNRQDKNAVLFRYVFRAIEVNPDMNWFKDMRRMRCRLIKLERDEFNRLYNIYKRKPQNHCPCEFLPLFPC